eukprot:gene17000-23278_t
MSEVIALHAGGDRLMPALASKGRKGIDSSNIGISGIGIGYIVGGERWIPALASKDRKGNASNNIGISLIGISYMGVSYIGISYMGISHMATSFVGRELRGIGHMAVSYMGFCHIITQLSATWQSALWSMSYMGLATWLSATAVWFSHMLLLV